MENVLFFLLIIFFFIDFLVTERKNTLEEKCKAIILKNWLLKSNKKSESKNLWGDLEKLRKWYWVHRNFTFSEKNLLFVQKGVPV